MARFETTVKTKPKKSFQFPRKGLIATGVTMIVISLVILGMSVYEGFFSGGNVRVVELPGFHELHLNNPGLYAGVYQHRGAGPIPAKELSQMDVRVMSKGDYQEVPVMMNTASQVFERFGMKGMPLFNFAIERGGDYTLSAVYTGAAEGPKVQVFIFPQAAQNAKQTLFVGVTFFALFLGLGIFILVKLKEWAPQKP